MVQEFAWTEHALKHGWYRRSLSYLDGSGVYEILQFWELVLYCRDVADAVGFSAQDIADLAAYLENDIWKLHPDLPAEQSGRAGYQRGKELWAALEKLSDGGGGGYLHKDEVAARSDLRRAKASLARHRRNQEKYGRPKTR